MREAEGVTEVGLTGSYEVGESGRDLKFGDLSPTRPDFRGPVDG